MQIKLLIIDDDIDVLSSLGKTFTTMTQGFLVLTATSANEGTAMLKEQRPDIVVLDYLLGEKSGIDLLKDYQEYFKSPVNKKYEPRYIVITGYPDDKIKNEIETNYLVDAYLNKPFKSNAIQKAVMAAIQKKIAGFYNQLCPYTGTETIEFKVKKIVEPDAEAKKRDAATVEAKTKPFVPNGKRSGPVRGRILIVDDYELLLESLHQSFYYAGFDVVKTTDPEQALELARTNPPDILITDINMPKLDGITMARRIKEIHPHIKIILMTGYHMKFEGNIKEAMAEGLVQRAVHKPFKTLQLQRAVDLLLIEKTSVDKNETQTSILFVDDEPEITDFLKEYFDDYDYKIFTANDAEKALAIYQESKPDIVVTDIKMPGRDGIWLIKEIRSENKDTNIIVMTGQDTEDTLATLQKETGISKYFSKPFSTQGTEAMHEVIVEIQLEMKKKLKK